MADRVETVNRPKIYLFWIVVFAITVVFAVMFAIRFTENKTFESYEDIVDADLDLHVSLTTAKEASYFVYVYSARKNDETGQYYDYRCDIDKAEELAPIIFNYFNYVRRNSRHYDTLPKIYGYNLHGNEDVLGALSYTSSDLPALVRVVEGNVANKYSKVNDIQSELEEVMIIE